MTGSLCAPRRDGLTAPKAVAQQRAQLRGRRADFYPWCTSGPRAQSACSPGSCDCTRSAHCLLAAAANRWIAACRSCSSVSPDPVAAARSWVMAARSWASAALRKARMLAAIARSAAASEAAIWRCAAANRALGAFPGASPWCSSSIGARTAAIRCLTCSPRLPPDSGSLPTRAVCPPHMARLPALIWESGFPWHSLNRRRRQVLGEGRDRGRRTGV